MTENDAAIAAALHAADVDERRRLAEDRALARTLEAAEEVHGLHASLHWFLFTTTLENPLADP